MTQIITYITRSLQDLYSPQELQSLIRMIGTDLLDLNEMDIYLRKDIKLSETKQRLLEQAVQRLQQYEPIQYVRGTADFYGMIFQVAPGVLIPRPETEELVELILKENSGAINLLDIGTGSGCIAISLARHLPEAKVEAWDVSEEALKIARRNGEALQVQVDFRHRDVFSDESVPEKYHVIVSNPPYITQKEKAVMDKNVLEWEPELALFVPNSDPLRFYRRIAELGLRLLFPGGKLYFEINQEYGPETVDMLEGLNYTHVRVIKDLFKNNRIVTAIR